MHRLAWVRGMSERSYVHQPLGQCVGECNTDLNHCPTLAKQQLSSSEKGWILTRIWFLWSIFPTTQSHFLHPPFSVCSLPLRLSLRSDTSMHWIKQIGFLSATTQTVVKTNLVYITQHILQAAAVHAHASAKGAVLLYELIGWMFDLQRSFDYPAHSGFITPPVNPLHS